MRAFKKEEKKRRKKKEEKKTTKKTTEKNDRKTARRRNREQARAPSSGIPPGARLLGVVAVYEAAQTHGRRQRQHQGVETQPGKINTNLLAVILPADDDKKNRQEDFTCSCFLYTPHHTVPRSATQS